MTRFRMGKQMVKILEVLNDLKNPVEHGYQEATYGINQTDIILRSLGIKPHTEKRLYGRERYIKPIDEGNELISEMNKQGKIIRSSDAGKNLVIDVYEGEYDYEPKQMRLASALIGKRTGQSASPYNFAGRVMAVRLASENSNDPAVKRHFDWVDGYFEGMKKADKRYASFSRSIKLLLIHGFITSDWYVKSTGQKTRHRIARYLITPKGQEYLNSRH